MANRARDSAGKRTFHARALTRSADFVTATVAADAFATTTHHVDRLPDSRASSVPFLLPPPLDLPKPFVAYSKVLNGLQTDFKVRSSATAANRAEDMDKRGEQKKTSEAVANRAVDECGSPPAEKSGALDHSSSTAIADKKVEKRGTTGDGGPEVNDENVNDSDMPLDEVDGVMLSEGKSKIFRLEGAVYSIGK
ncbi:hypothetical protein AGLY_014164 [Aphis glycines]|uniref:Uncharacterized protein n=1 Tax=Aphis glycines TaxID=307491 RepID=A0A6G0T4B0_APHGL|nr:hypothetical protein AGLY_014164 [Aphis glycines]